MLAKEIAKKYAEEVWDKKDLSAIEKYLDQHILIHSLLGKFYGHQAMHNVVSAWITAFPDLSVNNHTIVSESGIAVLHWDANATHLGEFKGIPATGNKISYNGVTLYRVLNNKIVEYWCYLDMQNLLKQLTVR